MKSFRETDGGLSSNRMAGEPLEAEKTWDLEGHVNKAEKESVTASGAIRKDDEITFRIRYIRNPIPGKRNSATLKSETNNSGLHTVIPLKLTV
jgi:hypothetical protein